MEQEIVDTALELLKEGIMPRRGTRDIDFAVMISSMKEYEQISIALETKGFKKVAAPWTLYSDASWYGHFKIHRLERPPRRT